MMKELCAASYVGSTKRSGSRNRYIRPLIYVTLVTGMLAFVFVFLNRAFSSYIRRTDCNFWLPNVTGKCTSENFQQTFALSSPKRRSGTKNPAEEIQREFQNIFSKESSDMVANGPSVLNIGKDGDDIYLNLSAFRRSYAEMEMKFKIYVYKDGLMPLVHQGPMTGIYASEGLFIDTMEQGNQFTTEDPERANMFFLPYSVRQMVTYLYKPFSRSMQPIKSNISNYVRNISVAHPYWNRTRGRDHFFVSCHDWAVYTLRDHAELSKNAIKVVCNADKSSSFNAKRDVSLPEIAIRRCKLMSKNRTNELGGPGPTERPFLAFFAGQMHGTLRPEIIRLWSNPDDPSMKIFGVLQSHPTSLADNITYIEYMKMSKYCLCPRGFDVNSPRLVEAIYYDCVPVVISDDYILPFADVLDWDKLAIRVAEKDISRLKQILQEVPQEVYESIQNRLKFARRHFLWHARPLQYDVFSMIVHSLWIRRLTA
ncbi:hypothetical protein SUGI_0595870 [Cryptomeria japonica]|nr:hypothetical protein SUGI_0595870 [Cryptomeria japonica]